jgi:hypothetical protein
MPNREQFNPSGDPHTYRGGTRTNAATIREYKTRKAQAAIAGRAARAAGDRAAEARAREDFEFYRRAIAEATERN